MTIDETDRTVHDEVFGTLCPNDLDRVAVIDDTGCSVTYGELRDAVDAFAGGLAARGVTPGHVVALHAHNGIGFVIAFFGIIRAGATVTTVGTSYGPAQIARHLQVSGATTYVTTAQFLATARAGALHLPAERVFVLDGAEGHESLADLLADDQPAPSVPRGRAGAPAILPCSSDPDGRAKVISLSHRRVVANLAQSQPALAVAPGDTVLADLPFSDIYGMNAVMSLTLRRRGTLVTVRTADCPRLRHLVQERRGTYRFVAPPVVIGAVG